MRASTAKGLGRMSGNRGDCVVVCRAMTDQPPAFGTTRLARRRTRQPVAPSFVLVLSLVAACSAAAGGTGGPSNGPTAPPTSLPSSTAVAAIDHPTGAKDVVLRVEQSGGFVPIGFLVTSAPSFTLYGDGTVVFRDTQAAAPEPVGSVIRSVPFETVKIDEEGIQALLEFALGPGGIGVAEGPYIGHVADMPATTFTVNAAGRMRQVSITAFTPELHAPQDQQIVTSLAGLDERLRTFGNGVAGEVVYEPAAYRGILQKVDQANGPVIDWPWTDIQPADFVPGVNDFLLMHPLTPAHVAVLNIPAVQGGMLGLNLRQGSRLFSLALRPLLPDEAS